MQFLTCMGLVLLFVAVAECRGNRKPSAMNDDTYNIIVKLVEGSFNVACAKRTVAEKSAITRFNRYRGRFTLQGDPPKLFLDGRRVLKKTEIQTIVMEEYYKEEGSGVRRIHNRLKDRFSFISEEAVRKVLSQCTTHRRLYEKFTHKAPYMPITANRVMEKVRVDLLKLKTAATHKERCYRYMLTAIDEFSRYTWLRPIETKSSGRVARKLSDIFDSFGPPTYIQHEAGSEFQGKVKAMLNHRGIKNITSIQYHPDLEGTVERSHKTLGSEILLHLISEKRSVDWARKLPEYATVLNDEPMEILGWNTPFNVFFGRFPDGSCGEKTSGTSNIQEWLRRVSLIMEQASTQTCTQGAGLGLHQQRSFKIPVYHVGDKVLVRLANTSRATNRLTILPGRIIERKCKIRKYKIAFTHPYTNTKSEQWFRLGDITTDTLSNQNKRKRGTLPRRQHFKNYYIPVTQKNRIDQLCEDSGLPVRLNPTGDGNCQFRAASDQLALMGISIPYVTLRQVVVQYLEANACFRNGRRWSAFLTETPENYLSRMSSNGSFGDHLTLQAIADIFNIQVLVISSLNGGTTLISPEIIDGNIFTFQLPYIVLGHLSEGNGEHYLSLSNDQEQVLRIIRNSAQIIFEGDWIQNAASETTNDETTDEGVDDHGSNEGVHNVGSSDGVKREGADEGVNKGTNDDGSHVLLNEEGIYDKQNIARNVTVYFDRLRSEILALDLTLALSQDVQSVVPAVSE
ncbi:uncharacterized protein [Diadema antillarum]|uniref:uncharacterized protein n=1 Tax=Diadema antillarum TaxID=105358 RepID=UPI003A837F29